MAPYNDQGYFLAWSVSFYAQAILNWERRSVTGLSIDFVIANVYGMLCYTVYTAAMYASGTVREEYRARYGGRDNLIVFNDVVFAGHALLIGLFICGQVAVYRRAKEGPSVYGLLISSVVFAIITGGFFAVLRGDMSFLSFLSTLSYIKLFLTVIKYIPQVLFNWRRRSTVGWSIRNVVLDLLGGLMSISQLFIDAVRAGDLSGIRGASVKLLLGSVTIFFDVIFILQHYAWFPDADSNLRIVSPTAESAE
jgi:cystinosin